MNKPHSYSLISITLYNLFYIEKGITVVMARKSSLISHLKLTKTQMEEVVVTTLQKYPVIVIKVERTKKTPTMMRKITITIIMITTTIPTTIRVIIKETKRIITTRIITTRIIITRITTITKTIITRTTITRTTTTIMTITRMITTVTISKNTCFKF